MSRPDGQSSTHRAERFEPGTARITRVVVFGWGNTSRGDDALGPLLLADLAAAAHPGVETIEDFQLQIEHALDMIDADLVLFIDAGVQTVPPFVFYEANPGGVLASSTHALSPETLLSVFQKVEQCRPPPAFVLCVRGERFELGAPMSTAATDRKKSAQAFIADLFNHADPNRWRAMVTAVGIHAPKPLCAPSEST